MKRRLLSKAIFLAGDIAIIIFQDGHIGKKEYAQGVALLTSVFEDARDYLSIAPPDDPYLFEVLDWCIVCTFVVNGDTLSEDLRELTVRSTFAVAFALHSLYFTIAHP